MTSIKTLPLIEGTKLIIVDEGIDAMHARKLIAGWIQMWKNKDSSHTFDLLLFSDPKSVYQNEPEPFISSNVNICDYYTINIKNIDTFLTVLNKKDFHNLEHMLETINVKSVVIIDCLTSLILFVGLAKALWFLEKLRNQIPQLICIYRRDFMQNKIPCIETLGNTYVKISKFSGIPINNSFNYVVEFVHRKIGGGILQEHELIIQNNTSYELQSEKLEMQSKKLNPICESQKVKSSFRIEINENEMKQRKETVLPYTLNANASNTSKIHYQPEDIDDIDEEDPDDDLCF